MLHPLCLSQFVYQMRKISALKVADKNDEKLKINVEWVKEFCQFQFQILFTAETVSLILKFYLSLSLSFSLSLSHSHTQTQTYTPSLSLYHSLTYSHRNRHTQTHTFFLPLSFNISLSLCHPDTHTLSHVGKNCCLQNVGNFLSRRHWRIKEIFFAAKEKKDSAFQKKPFQMKNNNIKIKTFSVKFEFV